MAFSDGLVGQDIPRQCDDSFLDRVSQTGPEEGPALAGATALGSISPGVHQCAVVFVTRQGYFTAPSPPVSWTGRNSRIHFKEQHMNIKNYLAGRKLSACILSVCLVLSLFMASAAEAASITLSWTFNYSVDPVCTASLTANCVSGFEYGTTPDDGKTLVKIGTAPNPTPASGNTATSVSVQFTQGPPYGAVVYYARTSGLDVNGNAVFSVPALASSVQITPAAPTNLIVTVK
jgi:hypothetical protein